MKLVNMLLDWPEQKDQLASALQKTMRRLAHGGLVAQVPVLTLYEGKRAAFIYPDGQTQEFTLKSVEAAASVDRRALASGKPELLVQAVQELTRGIGEQMEKDLIDLLRTAEAPHGGMFGGEDEEKMFQDLMRGLRQMDMSFDEDGRPSIFFVSHPENVMKLQALNTPDRQKVFDQLIEEKRREWFRRESDRRLVD